MENQNQLLNFIQKFFENLGAKIKLENNTLEISEVKESFEKFYGKNSPYKFTFQSENISEGIELIDKNSYIIKAISSYLENSGQTTLVKIEFKEEDIGEKTRQLIFANAEIKDSAKIIKHNFFFRFTFHTSLQYLTEKEKIINDIFIHEGKITKGDLSNYQTIEGNKSEVVIPDIKEPYFLAKEGLKKLVDPKIQEIALKLQNKLEKENKRINSHFLTENNEKSTKLERAKNRLVELMQEGDNEKVEKQEKLVNYLRENLNLETIQKDKERELSIENQRHALNVNNKLFNTTLIYYPLFNYNVTLKNQFTKRIFEISYDPLTEKLKELHCENCSKVTKEIHLCSTGHLSCKNCHYHCEECNKEYCEKCVKTVCKHCNKSICKDCSTRCFGCSKVMCKDHTRKDKLTGRVHCNACLKTCGRCNNLKDPLRFKESRETKTKVCEECFRSEMQKAVLKGVFDKD
jgi:hypothetical protein